MDDNQLPSTICFVDNLSNLDKCKRGLVRYRMASWEKEWCE